MEEPPAPTPAESRVADIWKLLENLPPVQRELLLEQCDPATVSVDDLVVSLGGTLSAAPPGHLQSMRALRVAQGLAPEPPRAVCSASELIQREAVLSTEQCAALRAAVDEAVLTKRGTKRSNSGEADTEEAHREALKDHLFARAFRNQLSLTREGLEGLIGPDAVRELWRIAASVPLPPGAAACGDDAPVEIFVRRYTPEDRPYIPFHNDRVSATVNVALADDMLHLGGLLLGVYDGAVHSMGRSEGEVTAHSAALLHAVTAMQAGVRYSLILFFRPDTNASLGRAH
jgi:hypothetical protein